MNVGGWRAVSLVALVPFVGLVAHEAGHVLTALALGEQIQRVEVMPGLRLLPELGIVPWDGTVATVQHTWPRRTSLAGLCLFMGSGATVVLAWLALSLLKAAPRRHPARPALAAAVILFGVDIVAYAVLPQLGLRHWIWIGGRTAEPLVAASLMGLPRLWFGILVAAHAIGLTVGLIATHQRTESTS